MKNKTLIRFVESFILLPVMTISGATAPMPITPKDVLVNPPIASVQKLNIETYGTMAINKIMGPKSEISLVTETDLAAEKILQNKANAVDAYFKERGMPLMGMGMKMVTEAEKNDLDWRLLAAISVRESTGGKNECIKVPNNSFGWGSCKIGFKSNESAIETVARNLGGNNPKTAHYYGNKTTIQILRTYNPPSIVPKYAEQVLSIMDKIGQEIIGEETPNT